MLKGLRFQKRLRLFPGIRIHLSKRGASASIGPRGADLNIGRDGITANAGLPGTGLSYRRKFGTHGGWLAVALVAAGAAFWAGRHSETPPSAVTARPMRAGSITPATAPARRSSPLRTAPRLAPGPVFVHRGGSVLRAAPKSSADRLAKLAKGAEATLIELNRDGWAKVQAGGATGYMRASVLGTDKPD